MKNVFLALALTLSTGDFALDNYVLDDSIRELAPDGYIVLETIYGDLNKDGQEDVVLIIKGTDPKKNVFNEIRGELDLNRRGIIIALKNKKKYEVIVENLSCFYPEGEYSKPDIFTSVEKGNLYILFTDGRHGKWRYNFRYQSSDFELIGYDLSAIRGPIVERVVSINYLTKKMVVKENINSGGEYAAPVFKERWKSFPLNHRFRLSEIKDFSEFDFEVLKI